METTLLFLSIVQGAQRDGVEIGEGLSSHQQGSAVQVLVQLRRGYRWRLLALSHVAQVGTNQVRRRVQLSAPLRDILYMGRCCILRRQHEWISLPRALQEDHFRQVPCQHKSTDEH